MGETAALLAVLALLTLACDRPPDADERRRVLHAVDAVREAPSHDRVRRRHLLDGDRKSVV